MEFNDQESPSGGYFIVHFPEILLQDCSMPWHKEYEVSKLIQAKRLAEQRSTAIYILA